MQCFFRACAGRLGTRTIAAGNDGIIFPASAVCRHALTFSGHTLDHARHPARLMLKSQAAFISLLSVAVPYGRAGQQCGNRRAGRKWKQGRAQHQLCRDRPGEMPDARTLLSARLDRSVRDSTSHAHRQTRPPQSATAADPREKQNARLRLRAPLPSTTMG